MIPPRITVPNGAPHLNGHATPAAPPAVPTAAPVSQRPAIVRLALLALQGSGERITGPVRVTIRHAQTRVVYDVTADEARVALGPATATGLSALEQAILGALTDAPQTARALARITGYRLNPHFRGGIRSLERREPPLCVRTADGYRRPPRVEGR
jgi:hypothetical protein